MSPPPLSLRATYHLPPPPPPVASSPKNPVANPVPPSRPVAAAVTFSVDDPAVSRRSRVGLLLGEVPSKAAAGDFAYRGSADHGSLEPRPREGGAYAALLGCVRAAQEHSDWLLTKIIDEEKKYLRGKEEGERRAQKSRKKEQWRRKKKKNQGQRGGGNAEQDLEVAREGKSGTGLSPELKRPRLTTSAATDAA
mmetsp:Transcript_29541/g.67916  ORF Transcript_29541/g.67916 Transcript_29541/m.67916 type:complete len:194 (-) Transcript_29541:226-807(-)